MNAKKVTVLYRSSKAEMVASKKEVKDCVEAGVKFKYQKNLVAIHGDKSVEKIEVVDTDLIKEEYKLRLTAVNIPDSNHFINCDSVIMTIGSHADPEIIKDLRLKLDKNGKIDIDANGHTSNKKIFAGGSVAGVRGTVAWASRSGRNAAYEIIKYLKKTN